MKMIGIGVPARATAPAACRARSAPGCARRAPGIPPSGRKLPRNCKAVAKLCTRSPIEAMRRCDASRAPRTETLPGTPRKLPSTRAKRPKRDDPNKKSLLTKHCLWLIGSSVDFEKGSQPDGHRFEIHPLQPPRLTGVALNLTAALLARVRNTKSAQDFRTLSMVLTQHAASP